MTVLRERNVPVAVLQGVDLGSFEFRYLTSNDVQERDQLIEIPIRYKIRYVEKQKKVQKIFISEKRNKSYKKSESTHNIS